VEYLILDEPEISSPIIMSFRTNDRSPLLAHILKLIDEFDRWTETDVSAPRRKVALREGPAARPRRGSAMLASPPKADDNWR
jgi:hypothetical protein